MEGRFVLITVKRINTVALLVKWLKENVPAMEPGTIFLRDGYRIHRIR
jgi:hypothetical protein